MFAIFVWASGMIIYESAKSLLTYLRHIAAVEVKKSGIARVIPHTVDIEGWTFAWLKDFRSLRTR